jgi:hypothetical protein
LAAHPNGLRFTVFDDKGDMLATNEYFSVGGGFVVSVPEGYESFVIIAVVLFLHHPELMPSMPTVPCWQTQVNKETQTAENLYYRDLNPSDAPASRRDQSPISSTDTSSTPVLPPTSNTQTNTNNETARTGRPKYLFGTADELLRICREGNMTIGQVVWENERAFRGEEEIRKGLLKCELLV